MDKSDWRVAALNDQEFLRKMYAYTRSRVVERCSRECIDDVFQDSMLSSVRSIVTFRGTTEGQLVSWCRTIIYHKAANHLRSCSRQRKSFLYVSPSDLEQEPAKPKNGDSIEQEEQIEQIRAVLREIPTTQAEAFLMKIIDDIDYSEIARRQGCTIATARWRVYRARMHLQDHFGVDLDDDQDAP